MTLSQNNNLNNHIISITWVILLLFPVGNIFYMLVPTVFMLLYNYRHQKISMVNVCSWLLIFAIFLSLILNISEPYISTKTIQRNVTLIVLLFSFTNLKIGTILKPYIWFTLIYVVISQIAFLYNITPITRIYDSIYDITGYYYEQFNMDISMINIENIGISLRLGGIFYNSNNCGEFISLIYALGLCESKQYKRVELILFCIIIFAAIFMTGSRTALLAYAAISSVYIYITKRSLALPIILIAVTLILLNFNTLFEFRIFKIQEGMDNSFGVKMDIIDNYLTQCNSSIDLLFGSGNTDVMSYNYGQKFLGTDCDLGDILVSYGLLFYIFYIPFYITIARSLKREYFVILLVLIWMFSNTIIFNYRMSAVWLLTLGVLYNNSLYSKTNETTK